MKKFNRLISGAFSASIPCAPLLTGLLGLLINVLKRIKIILAGYVYYT